MLLCPTVASVCLITFRPLWQNFEKEVFDISASLPEKDMAEIIVVSAKFYFTPSICSQIAEYAGH